MVKERGFYLTLLAVTAVGLLVLAFLIDRASKLPGYGRDRENLSTSSSFPASNSPTASGSGVPSY